MATAEREFPNNESVDLAVLRVVRGQAGVVSRRQLIDHGLSSQQIHRRVASGVLVKVLPRIYRHASAEECWLQQLWAAYLWAEERAVVSHEAAAALWKLDGCIVGPVVLATTQNLISPRLWVRVHRVRALPTHHITRTRGLAVTTPTRTLLDLAAVVGEEDLEAALDCALRRGSTSLPRLEKELGQSSGRGQRGRTALLRLLHERSPDYAPTHSVLETRFRRLLKRNGLPLPAQQKVIRRFQGGFAVVDFLFPEIDLVIELDGYSVHSSRHSWQHDRHRQNDLVIAGKKVLRFSWWDVCHREADVVDALRALLSPSLPFSDA